VIGLKLQKHFQLTKKIYFVLFSILIFGLGSTIAQPSFTPLKVKFNGLKRTKLRIVERELNFKPGLEILPEDTGSLFKKSAFNVFNTRLFNYCTYSVDSITKDSSNDHSYGHVNFNVHERWYIFPVPIFELADRNFNEWYYDRGADLRRVNIGLRFEQKNVRGLNEDLTLAFQGGFTTRLALSYFIPYLDKKQTIGLKLSASYATNRDVAYKSEGNQLKFKRDEESFGRERMGLSLQFSKRKSIYTYHYLDLNYGFNRISDFIYGLNPNYFNGPQFQRYGDIKYSFTQDKRNLRNFPTKGYLLNLTASRIGILPYDNFHLWTTRLSASKYWTLSPILFFSSKIDGEIGSTANQPYLGTRVLGFENRFARGYERYVIEGQFNFYTRNSIRIKAFSRIFNFKWFPIKQFQFVPFDIYISAFGDGGYVNNPNVLPENVRLANTALFGYGMGLNLVTFYDVVFRAEYSLTRQGDRGLFFSFLSDI